MDKAKRGELIATQYEELTAGYNAWELTCSRLLSRNVRVKIQNYNYKLASCFA
jgi:hypothetical protein